MAEALFNTVPCHPRVMSEIFNSSFAGRASNCIRKVDNTFGDIGPGAERSVIIRWLEQEFISPSNFLECISYDGFPVDEQLAGVFPKEREGKNEPRLFGILPLTKRLYIVLTEALTSKSILPLFPEITMTFDAVT